MISTLRRNVKGSLSKVLHTDGRRATPQTEEGSTDRFKKGRGDGDPPPPTGVKVIDPPRT